MRACTLLLMVIVGLMIPAEGGARAADGAVQVKVDWADFLARQDPVWEVLPTQWNDGAFLGNGELGDMIYADLKQNALLIHLGRADVTDHRNEPKDLPDFLKGKRPDNQVWGSGQSETNRIDIGDLALHPAGTIQSGTMRLDLWNAEVRGTLVTSLGRIEWSAYIHADKMLTVCAVTSTEKTPDGKPAPWSWDFKASPSSSPRWLCNPKDKKFAKDYTPNPDPVPGAEGDVSVCTGTLLAGGDFATGWKDHVSADGRGWLLATVANAVPDTGAAELAAATIHEGEAAGAEALRASHRAWWHAYYPESFVSLPDPLLESHYWIQMYKLACATRGDRTLIDDTGPFFKINRWPYATWDLNVQLCYRTMHDANRGELGDSLARYMRAYGDFRINRSIGKNPRHLGDWIWICFDLWYQYRHTLDDQFLRATVYPALHTTMAASLRALKPGDDGKLHLIPTYSPEYSPTGADFPDANYGLAMMRWGCQALIDVSAHLGIDDPLVPQCRDALAKLTGPPLDTDGTLMIAAGTPYAYSHRHYSHLIGIYPLHLYNWEREDERAMIEKSVHRWIETDGGNKLAGYSFTGSASMYAAMGKGDEAVATLRRFVLGVPGRYILGASTLYFEGGGEAEVIETPFSAAQTVQELLLQSWGDKVRVFPALPAAWGDVQFHDLRAEGAFLISAARKNGATQFVRVKSLAGAPCRVRVGDGEAMCVLGDTVKATTGADGVLTLDLKAGEDVVLVPANATATPALEIAPVPHATGENPFGLKAVKGV
jgi:hypothetical protein